MWRTRSRGFTLKHSVNQGFTLMELLVTIGVLAVLSASVLSLIGQGPQKSARDVRRKSDLEQIRSGLELYRNNVGQYPAAGGWEASLTGGSYMATVPTDPRVATTHYQYTPTCSPRCTTYTLCANGENPVSNCPANGIKVTNP